jgi:hypothetical protein
MSECLDNTVLPWWNGNVPGQRVNMAVCRSISRVFIFPPVMVNSKWFSDPEN